MKIKMIFAFTFISLLCIGSTLYAVEEIVLSTYYPAPYGEYEEVRSKKLAIGTTYADPAVYGWDASYGGNRIPDNTDLIVEGRIGIGIDDPGEKLEIRGDPDAGLPEDRNNILITNTGGGSSIIGHDGTGPFIRIDDAADDWSLRDSGGNQLITVLQTGEVGIGITTPVYDLDVDGTFRVYSSAGIAEARIESGINVLRLGNNGNAFYIENADGPPIRFLTIDSDGDVGIGTTGNDPGFRLHVQGGLTKTEGGLIIQRVADQTEEDALTFVLGQMWLRDDIRPEPA